MEQQEHLFNLYRRIRDLRIEAASAYSPQCGTRYIELLNETKERVDDSNINIHLPQYEYMIINKEFMPIFFIMLVMLGILLVGLVFVEPVMFPVVKSLLQSLTSPEFVAKLIEPSLGFFAFMMLAIPVAITMILIASGFVDIIPDWTQYYTLLKIQLLEKYILAHLLNHPKAVAQLAEALENADPDTWPAIVQAINASEASAAPAPLRIIQSEATKTTAKIASDRQNHQTRLRQLITANFTINDLAVLCFDLEIPYETIKGDSIDITVVNLITFCQQRARLDELLEACRDLRPHLPWPPASPSP